MQHNRGGEMGFTLLEILLVVATIAILAGIVILAINPNAQLGATRNAQRRSDVNTLLNAVYQYAIGHDGTMPASIPTASACAGTSTHEICRTDAVDCTGLVDLSVLTNNKTYIVSVPVDPDAGAANGSGYFVSMNSEDRVTVCAPNAEQGATITLTR
jgi:type IV pilus assembly protein PilA